MGALKSDYRIDKVYLINDSTDERANKSLRIICETFDNIGVRYEVEEVDCYDFHSIFNRVIKIKDDETSTNPRVKFHVNFSRGTAIAVAAVCCAAYDLDSDLYYVKGPSGTDESDDTIIPIPIENLHDVSLTSRQKEILLLFDDVSEITNGELLNRSGLESSKGALSRHTANLEKCGLLESREQISDGSKRRIKVWVLTNKGKKKLKLLKMS